MTTFVRIVAENGMGPYRNGDVDYRYDEGNSHPAPSDDGIHFFTRDHVFGFSCQRDLLKWFNLRMLESIVDSGLSRGPFSHTYDVVTYLVPPDHVIEGRLQIAAHRDHIKEKHRVSLQEFINEARKS